MWGKALPGGQHHRQASPVTVNPLPVTLACVTVTLEPPELVKVSDRVVLLPICTLPKLRLIEVAATVPGVAPVTGECEGQARVGSVAND